MSEIYRFEEFELDTARFQVRRGGSVIATQPQVFDVLHYLLRNHDRVVTKDELLEQVWSGRYISDTTLSSRIKAVRQLIGDTGRDQAMLRTFRNRGFRFVGQVEVVLTSPQRLLDSPVRDSGRSRGAGIAVLPFETIGTDESYPHLGEGVAADIIALLARHQWLRVISRGSSFSFADGAFTTRQIGASLGIRYLVTGRIRHDHARFHIDAELADCESDTLLWSSTYDREESDFFRLQQEISRQIAARIEPRVGQLEQQLATAQSPADLSTWGCVQRGLWHLFRFTTEDLTAAESWFRRALDSEPTLARAHAGIAYVAIQQAFYGAPADRIPTLQTAIDFAQRAVSLDSWDAFNRFTLGRALCLTGDFSGAEAELQSAIDLNPSFAQGWFALGFCYASGHKPRDSIPLFARAIDLSPHDSHLWTFHHMRSMAHFRLVEIAEAEAAARSAVRQQNATYWPFATLCALLGDLGRTDEAAAICDRLMQMKPGYSLRACQEDFFFLKDGDFVDRYLHGLRMAGVPDDDGPARRTRR